MSPSMPEMTLSVRIGLVAIIGFLILAIVAYHRWLDRRLDRPARTARPAAVTPAPAAEEMPAKDKVA